MNMLAPDADVVVIGAGAAGLAAAADLGRAGVRVRIVEARTRIGGRIWTLHDTLSGSPVELGAEFIHGKPREIWELLAAHPAETYESEGDEWCVRPAQQNQPRRLCTCDFFEQVELLLSKMAGAQDPDQTFAEFLATQDAPAEIKRHATEFVSGFNAADPNLISVRALVEQNEADEEIEGMRAFRVRTGYRHLVHALESEIEHDNVHLQTGCVVERVEWTGRQPSRGDSTRECGVRVTVRNAPPLVARAALITVPLAVLQAPPGSEGAIEFQPPLIAKQSALVGLKMGPVIRVTFSFRERFWANIRVPQQDGAPQTLANMNFLFGDDALFPTWWSYAPMSDCILTGWSAGPRAEQLSFQSEVVVVQQAMESLAGQLGIAAHEVERYAQGAWVHDWQADPFARGAYSYVIAGHADAPRQLAAPVEDTLFFAGEATDVEGHSGTVHGAIASGRRAAQEIVDALRAVR